MVLALLMLLVAVIIHLQRNVHPSAVAENNNAKSRGEDNQNRI